VKLRHAAPIAAAIALLLGSVPVGAQGPSPAVIAMRGQLLNPAINSFSFRDVDRVFEYRTVPRAGRVWTLPRRAGFAMPNARVAGEERDYDAFAERTFTNALLVIRDGRIVFEDYRNRSNAMTRFISFSMAKSITSLLVGKAVEEHFISSIDDRADKYVPELRDAGYGGVSIRQILQMRSGVDYEERYDFGQNPSLAAQIHTNAIVENKWRFADPATKIRRKTVPGSHFNYATLDTAVLGWILERATHQSLAAYTSSRLWGPTGMEAAGFWIADGPPGAGRELAGMGFNATLRDYGRLGLLMLNDGMRGGQQVLARGWMGQATTMLPFEPLPEGDKAVRLGEGYGLQFWQVDKEPGAYAAVGLAGQMIYVHPASHTVIVKLSFYPPVEPDYAMPETIDYFHRIVKMH
jgi:CubicO group peptidase (beta-lactamase class C family)